MSRQFRPLLLILTVFLSGTAMSSRPQEIGKGLVPMNGRAYSQPDFFPLRKFPLSPPPLARGSVTRGIAYESDGFYLSVLSGNDKAREMFGSVETRPEEVRALVAEMSKLWRRLSEVPPVYAYVTYRPIEKDRLKLLRTKYKVDPTPIEFLPSALQSLLIPVFTQPRNLSPLTQAQYEQLKAGKLAVTYKTKGYELSLFCPQKKLNLKSKG